MRCNRRGRRADAGSPGTRAVGMRAAWLPNQVGCRLSPRLEHVKPPAAAHLLLPVAAMMPAVWVPWPYESL